MLEARLQAFARETAVVVERDPYETASMWKLRQEEATRTRGSAAYLRHFSITVGGDQITLELRDVATTYDPETERLIINSLPGFDVPTIIRPDLSPMYQRTNSSRVARAMPTSSYTPSFSTTMASAGPRDYYGTPAVIFQSFVSLARNRARELGVAQLPSRLRLRLQMMNRSQQSDRFALQLIGIEWIVGTTAIGQWTVDRSESPPTPVRVRRRTGNGEPPPPPPPPQPEDDMEPETPLPPPVAQNEALDFSEVSPVIVGGLAALQQSVQYPDHESSAGIEGTVVVRFVVTPEGRAEDIAIARGVSPGLDAAAIAGVQRQRFTPGLLNGQPVRVRMSVPIHFRIR